MNDCTRLAPLLEVYADDEASAETNALVLDHVQHCNRCARQLHAIVSLRTSLRDSLGAGRAPDALRGRIGAAIDQQHPLAAWRRPVLWGRLTRWLVPASAALFALAMWIARERPADAQVETAVAEHVMCALQGRGQRPADAAAAGRRLGTAMPWIRGETDGLRLVEAHTCGDPHPFSHIVLDVEGSTASILITPREGTGAALTGPPTIRDGFDVTVLTTAKHVVYVVADRRHGDRLRALGGPALQRVERFLQQMEGAS